MGRIQMLAIGAAGAALVAAGLAPGAAQDATPAANDGMAGETFRAAVYEGTCGALAEEPSYQLADLAYGPLRPDSLSGGLDDATPMAGQLAAQDEVAPVAAGTTTLDLNMTELFVKDRQYAVAVSDPGSTEEIACANLGGPISQGVGQTRTTLAGTRLLVGLREVNGSGYGGVVWVEAPEGEGRGGGATYVTVFLVPPAEVPA